MGTVALLTDFGFRDAYVGMMKAVIAKISPGVNVIDLCHDIAPGNIVQGAVMLLDSHGFFPENTVFCSVVDPGVGSDRRPLCIRSRRYWFVGPDNGLLWPAADADGICDIIHLDHSELFIHPVSATFHGRDIFSPVSAHIAGRYSSLAHNNQAGVEPADIGSLVRSCMQTEIPRPRGTSGGMEITVIHVDRFGNLLLNLNSREFSDFTGGDAFRLEIGSGMITSFFDHYSAAPENIPFLITGSSARMEISVKNNSASDLLGAGIMQKGLLISS